MMRDERFTFLCNLDERQAIAQLAKHLHRTQSDAVRFVVIEATKQLTQTDPSFLTDLSAEDSKKEQGDAVCMSKGETHAKN